MKIKLRNKGSADHRIRLLKTDTSLVVLGTQTGAVSQDPVAVNICLAKSGGNPAA